jgi:predicted DsbA family dithiol-disulfide isomerase
MRVSGVPFFVIGNGDRPVGFSGAQPADMIAEVLQQQAEESEE